MPGKPTARLARIASPEASQVLLDYLDFYLPRRDLDYDQAWALAALKVIDRATGQDLARGFVRFAEEEHDHGFAKVPVVESLATFAAEVAAGGDGGVSVSSY